MIIDKSQIYLIKLCFDVLLDISQVIFMLKKSILIVFVDIAAFISFIFVVSTGVLMRYVLPPGSGQFTEILGMSRHDWGSTHFYITFLFLVILSMHLILHWRFISGIFDRNIKGASISRIILGLIGIVAVLAIAVAPFVMPKEYSGGVKGYQLGKHRK